MSRRAMLSALGCRRSLIPLQVAVQVALCACAATPPAEPPAEPAPTAAVLPLQRQVQQLGPAGASRFGFCDDDCPRPSPKTLGSPLPAAAVATPPRRSPPTP